MWHHWLEHASPQLKKLDVSLLLGFYHNHEMKSATKTFNQDPYFKKINFKLEPANDYQAIITGSFHRQ
jgi:hypothetical protein